MTAPPQGLPLAELILASLNSVIDCYIISAHTQKQFTGHSNQGVYGSINLFERGAKMHCKEEILIIKHNTLNLYSIYDVALVLFYIKA